jgi:RNA polymerase sigma-70 factor (ECF subfamily)
MSEKNPIPQTSLTLLERLRNQEPNAWERLIHLYRPLVLFWCSRWGVHGADADDITQDVFQVAAVRLANFRRDRPGDTFRGWLRGITRNKLLAHGRKASDQPSAVGGSTAHLRIHQIVDTATDEDADDPESELTKLLKRATELVRAEFEEATWKAFSLTAIDGKSATEVAQLVGSTPAAVRQAKSRILRRLRVELGELID